MKFSFKMPLLALFKYKPAKFSINLEREIRTKLDSLPSITKIYTNPDGTPRVPTEEEFKIIADLQNLYYQRNHSIYNVLKTIPQEQWNLYNDNSEDLTHFQFVTKDAGKIIDKIPYRDEATNELKWRIIRETEGAEGWEIPYFYIVLPIVAYIAYAKYVQQSIQRDLNGPDWAEREIRLRAMEDHFNGDTAKAIEFLSNEGKSKKEIRERDDLVIAKILGGDYDKLSELTKKMPKIKRDVDPIFKI